MHTQIEAIEVLAHTQQLPERQAAMKKVKKQVPALAALVDFWWAGVRQDLDHAGVSPLWRTWAQEALLRHPHLIDGAWLLVALRGGL